MPFSAIIFDLDGTLLNTIDDIADAANSVLFKMGFPTHVTDDYKIMVGEGMRFLALRALPKEKRDEETVLRWAGLVKRAFREAWPGETKPYDGIENLLDELSRRKVKLAILSNRPDDLTKMMVKDMLPRWGFEVMVGAKEGQPLKPDPTMALEISKVLRCRPEECVFLGDSNVDMEAAAAAHMYPIGALWGFRTAEELLVHGAKRLIKSPGDVLELF